LKIGSNREKKKLTFLKLQMAKKQKIACLGGGNAMPRAVLEGLKKKDVEISAICAMLDSGGSSGRLREDYGILSPGDIRRAFITLANTSPVIEELFDFRFESGQFEGHNFANLFIAALELSSKDFEKAFKELNKILNVSHQVLPVTLTNSKVMARLENGEIIDGETNIDIPKHNGNLKIEEVFLDPPAITYEKALEAILMADKIIIGPGDLYSTLAQILLSEGMSEAIKESSAQTIYICNLMTKYGETNGFKVEDFTKVIEGFLEGSLDRVIYNNTTPLKEVLESYKKEHPELLEMVQRRDKGNSKFIGADIISSQRVNHDPEKLAKVILEL